MHLYAAVHPLVSTVAAFIAAHDLREFDVGKSVVGSGIKLIVDEYTPQHIETGKKPEYHELYIDVQMVLAGRERIGYGNRAQSVVTDVYNQERDVAFVSGALDFVTLYPGNFALLFPDDVHLPGVAVGVEPCSVKKAVFKLPVVRS